MAGRPPLRIGAHGRVSRAQLGPGLWVARCRYRDDDGITRIVERRTPTHAEDEYGDKAEAALHEALASRRSPNDSTITDQTPVSLAVQMYLRQLEDDGRTTATLDTYRFAVGKLGPHIAGVRVGEARPRVVNAVLQSMKRDHGVTMARQAKTVLRGAFALAVMDDALDRNPVSEVRPLTAPKKSKKGAVAMSGDQLRALFAALYESDYCRRNDLADPITLLIATGLRRSELLALRWADIDEAACTVTVTARVVRVKGAGLERQESTKSAAGQRVIRLPAFAMAMLLRRSQEPRPTEGDLVFPSSVGTLRDPNNLGKQWRTVREELGVPDTTSHSFRKSMASLLDDHGLSARVGADVLGHAAVSMTQNVYMQRGRQHPEVAALLDEVLAVDKR